MTRTRMVGLGAVVAVAAVAGCSGGDAPESVAGAADPVAAAQAASQGSGAKVCALLKTSEVEAVFGTTVKTPEPTDGPIVANCGFKADGAGFHLVATVSAYQDKTQGQFDEQKAYQEGNEPVSGLGDEAYAVTSGHETIVSFRQGDRIGEIAKVYTGSRDEAKTAEDTETMIGLARQMSARL
ncbi:hypothetical protein JIG36_34630 [Actinoplanes sp. LDG1-06]|uniref:DUF3558 domain-containing protein n=1 Tax=Paractinoplanes ovalisporus TaxID=2810368 RepID=A0ABS2ALC6_9ACTN|nr:hypothetical protein [Actinoplanes ovalisporus]MBM2620649.1 hypothetical protein [Actinoplanes ovalisporus]